MWYSQIEHHSRIPFSVDFAFQLVSPLALMSLVRISIWFVVNLVDYKPLKGESRYLF